MSLEGRNPSWSPELLNTPHQLPDKAQRVRSMFNAIAPRYELVNRLLSVGKDAAWRRRAVALAEITEKDRVLDVACGTGDLARAFVHGGAGAVVGCDFAHDMIRLAKARPMPRLNWCEADALALPFCDECFDVASCAFGIRNFQHLQTGLAEMYRVLRRSGRAVILEFSLPQNRIARAAYGVYSNQVMPRLASWISGDRNGAYRYLPRSIASFPNVKQVAGFLKDVGFSHVRVSPLTMGIVTVYVALKDGPTLG